LPWEAFFVTRETITSVKFPSTLSNQGKTDFAITPSGYKIMGKKSYLPQLREDIRRPGAQGSR